MSYFPPQAYFERPRGEVCPANVFGGYCVELPTLTTVLPSLLSSQFSVTTTTLQLLLYYLHISACSTRPRSGIMATQVPILPSIIHLSSVFATLQPQHDDTNDCRPSGCGIHLPTSSQPQLGSLTPTYPPPPPPLQQSLLPCGGRVGTVPFSTALLYCCVRVLGGGSDI